MKKFDIVAKTLFGFEELLAAELETIGATDIEILRRAVKYTGTQETLYKSNYLLRTAIKILVPMESFTAWSPEEFYDKIQEIDWYNYMRVDQTLAVDATANGEVFTHSQYIALKCKDAIVDQFRDNVGERPSVDTEDPDLRLNIHINNNHVNLSLDSSGKSLGKRGYKTQQVFAPLSEVMAAGMVLLSEWDRETDFLDPMSGSGTIPIEAALIAYNIAPGKYRNFTFQKWDDYNEELFDKIKQEAEAVEKKTGPKIFAFDQEIQAVEICNDNIKRAGVEEIIETKNISFLDTENFAEKLHIMINPPYGARLEDEDDMIDFYDQVGTHLKHKYNGSDAWILSGNLRAIKFVGLKASKKIKIFNGPIECRLNKFELYRGSKKQKKED